MASSPKPVLRQQEDVFQHYPKPGSNSWARVSEQVYLPRMREVHPAHAPKPGSNSWAQLDEEAGLVKKPKAEPNYALKVIPSGTFAEKPLPPLPKSSSSPCTTKSSPREIFAGRPISPFAKTSPLPTFVARFKKYAQIKPTSALDNLGHTNLKPKKARGTEQVTPRFCFQNGDEAVSRFCEMDAGSVCVARGFKVNVYKYSPQPTSCLEKRSNVAQIPGVYSAKAKNQIPRLVSSVSPDDPSCSAYISNADHSVHPSNIVHQLTYKRCSTSRYLLENRLSSLTLSERHGTRRGILKGAGRRKLRRTSNFGDVRRVRFASTIETRRLSSQIGLIKSNDNLNDRRADGTDKTAVSLPNHSLAVGTREAINYSESEYSEEDDPKIDNSHPHPLSPLLTPNQLLAQKHSDTQLPDHSQNPIDIMPLIEDSQTDRSPRFVPASPGIWWNAGSRGNSFASSTTPSSLVVAPLFAGQDRDNAVPAPPASSHPNYQQMTPIPAELAQVELNLHHHIDSGINCLTRILADKTDRISDQLVRRLEAMEEKAEKSRQNLESKLKEVLKECVNLSQENKGILKELDLMKDAVRAMDLKTELVKGLLEENRCNDHSRQNKPSESTGQSPDYEQVTAKHVPQNKTASGSSASTQIRQAQTSVHGSQEHLSSPIGSERAGGSSKKNLLLQTEGVERQAPDLKDHPAFSGGQSSHPLIYSETPSEDSGSGVVCMLPIFQTPSFRDGGWYKQAYGQ